jgi:hypothetical protein
MGRILIDKYTHIVLVFLGSVRRLLVTAIVVPRSPIVITLMTEAPHSSETPFLQESHVVTTQEINIL